MSQDQCLPRYRWCSCLLHNRCSVLFPCMPTQRSVPRLTEVRILSKIPGFTRISWYAFDTRYCTTSKPLIGPQYTKVLIVSSARYQVSWKQEVAQSVRPIHWLPRVWFMCWQSKENEVVSHHAWNTCVVFDEQANIPRVLVYYTKTDGTLHLLVCETNQLVHLLAQHTAGLSQQPVK
jgi:hypothetical protein